MSNEFRQKRQKFLKELVVLFHEAGIGLNSYDEYWYGEYGDVTWAIVRLSDGMSMDLEDLKEALRERKP